MSEGGDDSSSSGGKDVAILGGPTERGDGVKILRLRDGQVEVGELRAAPEGKPLLGESVRLHPRAEEPRVCDVEVLTAAPRAAAPGVAPAKGPAKVSTEAYRSGWEAVFGTRDGGKGLPN